MTCCGCIEPVAACPSPMHGKRGVPPCLVVPGDVQVRLRDHARLGCNARVAGRAEQRVAARRLRQLPGKRVLPAASAHQQHIHLVWQYEVHFWDSLARFLMCKHRS